MPDERVCPRCESGRVRRGGRKTWAVYLGLLLLAIPAVLVAHLHAGLVAAIMLAAIVLAHLVLNERVCLECGHQWRG